MSDPNATAANGSTLNEILSNVVTDTIAEVVDVFYNGTSDMYSEFLDEQPIYDPTNGRSLNATRSTNLTKVTNETTQQTVLSSEAITESTLYASTTIEDPYDEFGPPDGIEYIFVPLGVMIFVIVLSVVVLIVARRRKLERLRHRLMPLYNFDPGEEGEDDWETELLDEGFDGGQRRRGYRSMDTEENAELFGGQ